MRKLFSFLFCFTIMVTAQAQTTYDTYNSASVKQKVNKRDNAKLPACYIGFSMGINNPAGILGFDVNIPLAQYVTLDGGAGTSTWGNKLYVGSKYYLRSPQRGWAFGGGLTFNSGMVDYKTKLETQYNSKRTVTLNLHSQTNIFLGVYHYWTLGRRQNRFHIELGRSIPLNGVRFQQVNTYGDPISDRSRRIINVLAPGGFMAGFGFSFGLYNKGSNSL